MAIYRGPGGPGRDPVPGVMERLNRLDGELSNNGGSSVKDAIERMLKVATTSPSDNKVAFPSDFLELREMHLQGNPPILLEFQTPDLFFRNGQTTLSGRSHYFTMLGTEFQFAPSQDTSYTVQILYYAQPTFISSTTASNLFLAYYPDALLYATLAEAEPYLYNDPRIATWSALYDRAIANIKKSDLGQTYAYTTLSVTPR